MKKHTSTLLALCLICALAAGCSVQAKEPPPTQAEGPTILAEETNFIDLAVMGSGEALNMLTVIKLKSVENLGKTIRLQGTYQAKWNEEKQEQCHYITIKEDECCQQNVEFLWNGHEALDGYAEDGAMLEITGVYEGYEAAGCTWYRIVANEVIVL